MATDWIKMRTNLWDDPRVTAMADDLDVGEATVVGALFRLWTIGDQHTDDGVLRGLSAASLDRKTGVPGFAAAAINAGWLEEGEGGIKIPRFEEHNGASAKRRAKDASRKASQRKTSGTRPQTVRKMSASDADKPRTHRGQSAELEREREREKESASAAPAPKKSSNGQTQSEKSIRDWCARFAKDEFKSLDSAARRFAEFRHEWIDPYAAERGWLSTWLRIGRQARTSPQQMFAAALIGRLSGEDWGGDGEDDDRSRAWQQSRDRAARDGPMPEIAAAATHAAIPPEDRDYAERQAELQETDV